MGPSKWERGQEIAPLGVPCDGCSGTEKGHPQHIRDWRNLSVYSPASGFGCSRGWAWANPPQCWCHWRRERAGLGAGRSNPEPAHQRPPPQDGEGKPWTSPQPSRGQWQPQPQQPLQQPPQTGSPSGCLCRNPPAQRVANELAAAGLQEHLNVLFSAAKGQEEVSHLPGHARASGTEKPRRQIKEMTLNPPQHKQPPK